MESLQLHFYSMLKQSEYVRTGATKKIMNMSKNEQTQLWEGLRTRTSPGFEDKWAGGSEGEGTRL